MPTKCLGQSIPFQSALSKTWKKTSWIVKHSLIERFTYHCLVMKESIEKKNDKRRSDQISANLAVRLDKKCDSMLRFNIGGGVGKKKWI